MTKPESNEMQLSAVLFSPVFVHLSVKEPKVCDPLLWEKQEQVPCLGSSGGTESCCQQISASAKE